MTHEEQLRKQKAALMPLIMKGLDTVPMEAPKWDATKTKKFLEWNRKARAIMNRSRLSLAMMAKVNAEAMEWHAGTPVVESMPRQSDFVTDQ